MIPKISDSDPLQTTKKCIQKFAIVTPLIKLKIFLKNRDRDALTSKQLVSKNSR